MGNNTSKKPQAVPTATPIANKKKYETTTSNTTVSNTNTTTNNDYNFSGGGKRIIINTMFYLNYIYNQIHMLINNNINHSSGNSANSNNSNNSNSNNSNNSKLDDKSKRLDDFFEKYKEQDENCIGPDGIVRLCKDLGVEPEDIVVLILAWHLGAKQMGFFQKSEFIGGLSRLNIDSLQKLQSHLTSFKKELDDPTHFKEIYRFAFIFAKENETNKILDLESACSMIQLVLADRYPHTEKLQEFLLSQKSYKVLNMDQWLSILEFSKIINATCSNYDENGAWPVILDEYVDWCKAQTK